LLFLLKFSADVTIKELKGKSRVSGENFLSSKTKNIEKRNHPDSGSSPLLFCGLATSAQPAAQSCYMKEHKEYSFHLSS
jgi:hypothetical protein